MNYLTDERRNALAAEYVLGTMRGLARARFQRLLIEHPRLRETTQAWEQQVNGLGESLRPVAPDQKVWTTIAARLGLPPGLHQTDGAVVKLTDRQKLPPQASTGVPGIGNWWKGWSIMATAAAVVLAVLLLLPADVSIEPRVETVAVMQNEAHQPLWLLEIRTREIYALATKNLPQQGNNDYELWMVAKDGRPPISLGLLPQAGERSIPKHALFDSLDIAVLAVSLEPKGGSPTGSPTTVLYTAELI